MRSAPGGVAGEPGELAVVRGEHGRTGGRWRSAEHAAASRAERGEPVAVDDGRDRGLADQPRGSASAVASAVPRPGPTARAREAVEPAEHVVGPALARAAGDRPPRSAASGRRRRPASSAARSPAPARCAAPAARWAAPVMPGEPATTSTPPATCGCDAGAVGSQRRRRPPRRGGRGRTTCRARCRPPRRRRPASGPSPSSRPGLSAANVTVRVGRAAACPRASPVSPSTPDGMSTASTGGAGVGQAGARRTCRGSRCRTPRRSRGRTAGSGRARSAASMHRDPHACAPPGRRAAARPSLPLLPLPATTTTRRP